MGSASKSSRIATRSPPTPSSRISTARGASCPEAQTHEPAMNPDLELHGQSAFDRGVDPIDDPQVIAFLDAHPEELERFAHWRAATLHLDAVRKRRAWPAAAALLGLAGVAVVAWTSFAAAPARAAGRIASATLQIETTSTPRAVRWSEHQVLVAEPNTLFTITRQRSARP